MSKNDISNLKRQITARRMNAAEKALQQCLSWNYGFITKEWPDKAGHVGPTYVLHCSGIEIGKFTYYAAGSRPHPVLSSIWRKSGAGMPWLDTEVVTGTNVTVSEMISER